MKSTKVWMAVAVLLGTIGFCSCSNDDETLSLTLTNETGEKVYDKQNNTINIWLGIGEVSLRIEGGDGKYTFAIDDREIVDARCEGETLTLIPLEVGVTKITVKDSSGKSYSLLINVSLGNSLQVDSTLCVIYGDEMTAEDKARLKEEVLASPIKGYQFIHQEAGAGKVRLYPEKLGGAEYTEYDFVDKADLPEHFWPVLIDTQISFWYLLTNDTEELALFITRQWRPETRTEYTRSSPMYSVVLDVTARYKANYPDLERIYLIQE